MAKLSRTDGLKKKETRREIVTRLKAKKVSGEKLTWKERVELHWVMAGLVFVFGGWTTLGVLLLLEFTKVIDIF